MANKRNVLDRLEIVSKALMEVVAEVEDLKSEFQMSLEMNTRLRLENEKLRERLEEMHQQHASKQTSSGLDSLEKIYADGFHICTTFYGQPRESKAECFFCTELLDRE